MRALIHEVTVHDVKNEIPLEVVIEWSRRPWHIGASALDHLPVLRSVFLFDTPRPSRAWRASIPCPGLRQRKVRVFARSGRRIRFPGGP